MHLFRVTSTVTLLITFSFLGMQAQVLYPDSELLSYYRVLELKNIGNNDRMNIFPSIVSQYTMDSIHWNIWFDQFTFHDLKNKSISVLPFCWTNQYNSKYARGYNDGALWKGRGYTASIQGGVQCKFGILEFTLAPLVYFSQNERFELAPQQYDNDPYNYQFRNKSLDDVQRYGNQSFTSFNMGQTDIRLVLKSFTIGISTQNIIWGAAQQNPIILSNNAAGIPHIDIGTQQPLETKIGRFEGKIYYGNLKKSNYFDTTNVWNNRYWSGLSLAYNPSILSGLTIGFNRSFYKNRKDFSISDLWVVIAKFDDTDGNPAINDEYDQMGSLTLRWVFKEVGFETYLEYGKNDFGGKLWGTEPEHARAYTVGISKYIDIQHTNVLQLTYEHTSLDKPKNSIYRVNNSWYSHSVVRPGYTTDGQVLGGGIGSGSTSDFFSMRYFYSKGTWQLLAQRIRLDDDYFFENIKDVFNHDHEWTLESRFSRFIGHYLIGFDCAFNFRQNQYFIRNNNKTNVYVGLNFSRNLKFIK